MNISDNPSTAIFTSLENLKLSNIQSFENTFNKECDTVIIATARSSTHLNSSTENIKLDVKKLGFIIIGVEGIGTNWAIVDLASIVIHIMLNDAREYYELDKLFYPSN